MFKRIKALFINGTVLLLTVFFTLGFAEILARILIVETDQQIGQHQFFCEYDPILGWKKIPYAKGKHVSIEYSVFERFNSKGIRGPEYSYHKNDGEYRIFVLGDSFAEGYTVEFNELFSEVLKAGLNRENKKYKYYQVINSGTGGWSTDQELLFFQHEGQKYNPDLTVLMFYENDVWYNNQPQYWRGFKPLFQLDNGKLFFTNNPVPKPEMVASDSKYKEDKEFSVKKIKKWFNQKSHLYRFISGRIKNIYWLYSLCIKLGFAHQVQSNEVSHQEIQLQLIPEEFGVWKKAYTLKILDAWKITEAMIVKLNAECDSVGSKLLIFYIPTRVSIYAKEWEDTKKKYGLSDEDWNINQAGMELQMICTRNNIDFINPSEAFRFEAKKLESIGEKLYFAQDGHWNAKGNKFVGDMLMKYIMSHY